MLDAGCWMLVVFLHTASHMAVVHFKCVCLCVCLLTLPGIAGAHYLFRKVYNRTQVVDPINPKYPLVIACARRQTTKF